MHICLLDIDGTLVLTGGAGQTAFARALAKEFGIEQIDCGVSFAGRSDRAIASDLFDIHGIELSDENWEQFRVSYLAGLDEALPTHVGQVLPGVENLLHTLSARGDVAIGLLTGNVHEAARRKLMHYGLWHWFPFGGFGDHHVDRCDIAAAALSAAQSHLNGSASDISRVLVIGDTLNDIRCGRSIGARCIAVPTGHTPADELLIGNPDLLVPTLEEMGPILALLDA